MKKLINLFLISLSLFILSCRQSSENLLVDNGVRYAILLNVSSPKSQDIYKPGDKVRIKWNVLSEMKKVDIHLYKKSEYILTISPGVVNTGEYLWTIPSDINQSHHYKIRVMNHEDPTQFNFSEVFYILFN